MNRTNTTMDSSQGAGFGGTVQLTGHCLSALEKVRSEKTDADPRLPEASLAGTTAKGDRMGTTADEPLRKVHGNVAASPGQSSVSELNKVGDGITVDPVDDELQTSVSEAARLRQTTQALRIWQNDMVIAGLRATTSRR